MAKKPFTEHEMFSTFADASSTALIRVAESYGLSVELQSLRLEPHANRLVDDLTKLLLRLYDTPTAHARRVAAGLSQAERRITRLELIARTNRTLARYVLAGR